MARDILFRGKRVDNGEWVYGNFVMDATELQIIENHIDKPIWANGFIRRYDFESQKVEMYEVERETVGQYIGFTDKNGTKIFEGDIVHCVARLDEADCIVVYDDGEFRLVAEDRYKDYPTLGGYYAVHCFEKEVIGNIHEQG